MLVNPANASSAEATLQEIRGAARAIGLQILALNASTSAEIEAAFGTAASRSGPRPWSTPVTRFLQSARAIRVAGGGSRNSHGSFSREAVEAGALMSYATDGTDMFRQVGVYTGQILKGAKPSIPGHAVDQVRAGDQPRDGESARPPGAGALPPVPTRRSNDPSPRVHHASRRCGGGLAARGAVAAGGGAGDRISSRRRARGERQQCTGISKRLG